MISLRRLLVHVTYSEELPRTLQLDDTGRSFIGSCHFHVLNTVRPPVLYPNIEVCCYKYNDANN